LIVNGGGEKRLDRRDAACAEKGNGEGFNTQGHERKTKASARRG